MSLKKFLVIPQLVYYGVRAPRDQGKAWDRFWGGIRRTGAGGDVLWDAGDRRELDEALAHLQKHGDPALPLVDLGCGNGRYTRAFAAHFPRAIGVDVSPQAVTRATEESGGLENVSHRVLDAGEPGAGARLRAEIGAANVFMRGVFHVLEPARRAAAVQNLHDLLGGRGALYLSETNIEGDPLDHLVLQGATPTSMPEPLRRCIEAGIRPPSHFGEREVREHFPADRWEVLAQGPLTMYTLPVGALGECDSLPSYFAALRARV
jgi:SAM-dependent methyltransferase